MDHTQQIVQYAVGPVAVRMTRFSCRAPICYEVPRLRQTRLSIVLDEVGGIARARIDPVVRYVRPHVRHEVAVLPPGARAWMVSERIVLLRTLSLLFDWSELPKLTGVAGFPAEPRLQIAERDASIFQLGRLLAAALEDEHCVTAQALGDSYAETLVRAILLRAGGASLAAAARSPSAVGLRAAQLRAVLQALDNDLGRRPDVAKLANSVGLSQSHFYRAFKLATGETPCSWQRQSKIRRAQELLRQPGAKIAQVAAAAGFADQSHFARTFKEIVGSTPRAWLRTPETVRR